MYCAVLGCTNSHKTVKKLSYYCLPRNPVQRKKWIKRIGRKDILTRNTCFTSYRVCSEHFEPALISLSNRLQPGSLPSLNLPQAGPSNDGPSSNSPAIADLSQVPQTETGSTPKGDITRLPEKQTVFPNLSPYIMPLPVLPQTELPSTSRAEVIPKETSSVITQTYKTFNTRYREAQTQTNDIGLPPLTLLNSKIAFKIESEETQTMDYGEKDIEKLLNTEIELKYDSEGSEALDFIGEEDIEKSLTTEIALKDDSEGSEALDLIGEEERKKLLTTKIELKEESEGIESWQRMEEEEESEIIEIEEDSEMEDLELFVNTVSRVKIPIYKQPSIEDVFVIPRTNS